MKKSLLLTLAASAMLCASVFTGCSDLPEEYYPSAETKAAQAAAEKAAKKPAVPAGATAIVDFTKMTDNLTLLGKVTLVKDTTFKDGTHVLSVDENSWNVACAKLDKTVDLTGKKLYILAKGKTAKDSGGSNDGIAVFISSDNARSATDDNNWSARSDADIVLTDDSEFNEYEVSALSKFYNAKAEVDSSKVQYVGFRLKNAKFGKLQIAAIYYK